MAEGTSQVFLSHRYTACRCLIQAGTDWERIADAYFTKQDANLFSLRHGRTGYAVFRLEGGNMVSGIVKPPEDGASNSVILRFKNASD